MTKTRHGGARPGSGRKRLAPDEKVKITSVGFNPTDVARVRALMDALGVPTRIGLIRLLLAREARRQGIA